MGDVVDSGVEDVVDYHSEESVFGLGANGGNSLPSPRLSLLHQLRTEHR